MTRIIETDCMGDLLVADTLGETKHADHDQSSHGRRYGRLVPGDKMDLFPDLPVKVHRGVMTSRASSPEDAVERVSDDWRGAGVGYGRHWATKPSTAERHAVGTHNLSSAWVFGKRPDPDGVYGVVITAHFPEGTAVREGTSATMWAGEDEVDLPAADPVFSFEVWSIDEAMRTTKHGVFIPQEAKHAGPGPHPSTGTSQQAHAGGRGDVIEDPTARARMAIFEGVTEVIDISAEAERIVETFQMAIDSGQLSVEPSEGFKHRASPLEVFERARDVVPTIARAAMLGAGRDPDAPVHNAIEITQFESLMEVAQDVRDKKMVKSKAMLLDIITSEDRIGTNERRIAEWEEAGRPLVEKIRRIKKDHHRYDEEFKAEVQQQVMGQWKQDDVTAAEAITALNRLGHRPPLSADGLTEEEALGDAARTLVATWAHTSNDRNPVALSVQEIAERHFKVEDAAGWEDGSSFNPEGEEDTEWVIRSALQGMHDRTQEWFAERGVEEVTLYRGQKEYEVVGMPRTALGQVIVEEEDLGDGRVRVVLESGGEAVLSQSDPSYDTGRITGSQAPGAGFDEVRQRPLSSWSLSSGVADGFAAHNGSVMTAEVPVSRILSLPRTGFGCTNEEECVVLGGVMDIEWHYGGIEQP